MARSPLLSKKSSWLLLVTRSWKRGSSMSISQSFIPVPTAAYMKAASCGGKHAFKPFQYFKQPSLFLWDDGLIFILFAKFVSCPPLQSWYCHVSGSYDLLKHQGETQFHVKKIRTYAASNITNRGICLSAIYKIVFGYIHRVIPFLLIVHHLVIRYSSLFLI